MLYELQYLNRLLLTEFT